MVRRRQFRCYSRARRARVGDGYRDPIKNPGNHWEYGGTATSPGVQFGTVLPIELPALSFQSVTKSDGSACMVNFVDGQVYIACYLGDMAVGAQKTITIVVTAPLTLGTFGTLATAYPADV